MIQVYTKVAHKWSFYVPGIWWVINVFFCFCSVFLADLPIIKNYWNYAYFKRLYLNPIHAIMSCGWLMEMTGSRWTTECHMHCVWLGGFAGTSNRRLATCLEVDCDGSDGGCRRLFDNIRSCRNIYRWLFQIENWQICFDRSSSSPDCDRRS